MSSIVSAVLLAVGIGLCGFGIYATVKRYTAPTTAPVPVVGTISVPESVVIIALGLVAIIASVVVPQQFPPADDQSTSTASGASTAPPAGVDRTVPRVPSGDVRIDSPKDGASVGACEEFSGTSDLPEGKTLVVAVTNESDRTGTLYLAAIHDWQDPGSAENWTATQFFGTDDGSVGQTYRVRVFVADTKVVEAADQDPKFKEIWSVTAAPEGFQTKAALRLTRRSGAGPDSCSS